MASLGRADDARRFWQATVTMYPGTPAATEALADLKQP